jgi:poly(3-hydroxybutyrate) depolymerase
MQKQVLVPLAFVALGLSALSCAPADSDSSIPDGTGGDTADTGTAGSASSESGDAAPVVTGDAGATGTLDAGATGTTDAGATGNHDASATGTRDAGATGTTDAGSPGGIGGPDGGGMAGSGDYWGGLKNPPGKSAGCGKAATITNGKKTIMSGGRERAYIIDVPANYDANKPYRLFYASHGLGGRAEDVAGWNYFDLKTQAAAAKEPAVFIAPQGIDNRWGEADHALFDDITTFVKNGLCIDTTRVFVTGMSFGGMITYSLSTNHQKKFRAGVGLAPVNYVIWLPATKLKDPIAWMQTTGVRDTVCPWVSNDARKEGAMYIALEKAADNGCKPATIPTWQSGKHLCYDFEGCKPGYPVKACTFNGGHDQSNSDPSSNTNWIAEESWKFFTQF